MLRTNSPRSVLFLVLTSIAVSAAPPSCSLNAEGEYYSAGAQGSSGASSGEPVTASASGSSTSGGPGVTTGTGGEGGAGTGGASASSASSASSTSGAGGVGGEGTGGEGGILNIKVCGDGEINVEGEECDDGNIDLTDGCSGCKVACPMGWDEEPTTHHCFQRIGAEYTFNEANQGCAAVGATLAVLATQAEIDFVKDDPDEKTWIGGSHKGQAWVWVNGPAMDMAMPPWANGEPSGGDGCAVIGNGVSAGRFFGESCAFTGDYLCEIAPPGTVP